MRTITLQVSDMGIAHLATAIAQQEFHCKQRILAAETTLSRTIQGRLYIGNGHERDGISARLAHYRAKLEILEDMQTQLQQQRDAQARAEAKL